MAAESTNSPLPPMSDAKGRKVVTLTTEDSFSFSGKCMVAVGKLGGAGDRFGDYLCLDFTSLPYISGQS